MCMSNRYPIDDENAVDSKCVTGHHGFVCATCDESFFRDSSTVDAPCTPCSSLGSQLISLLLMAIGGLSLAVYIIYKNLQFGKKLKKKVEAAQEVTGPVKPVVTREKESVVRRLFLSHIQLIGLVGQFELHWPAGVTKAMAVTDSVASFSLLDGGFGSALDCLVRPEGLMIPMFNVLVSIGLLLMSSILVIFFWCILYPAVIYCTKRNAAKVTLQKLKARRHVKMLVSVITLW